VVISEDHGGREANSGSLECSWSRSGYRGGVDGSPEREEEVAGGEDGLW